MQDARRAWNGNGDRKAKYKAMRTCFLTSAKLVDV